MAAADYRIMTDATGQRIATALEAQSIDKAAKVDLTSIITTGTTNATGATIANGTYFYLNGALVQAKADIASGATFTSGTNYESVTAGGLNSLNDQIANIGGLIAGNTTSNSTMSGTLDLTNAHAVIAVINVHNIGDVSIIVPLDGTQTVYGYIKFNDNYWASVRLQLTKSTGQYTISFDAKGPSTSTFDYAYFYRL